MKSRLFFTSLFLLLVFTISLFAVSTATPSVIAQSQNSNRSSAMDEETNSQCIPVTVVSADSEIFLPAILGGATNNGPAAGPSIREVMEDTGGCLKFVGDTIHFTLDAGETGGTASVDIGDVHKNIALYDNGTHGDAIKNDGIYELDYVTGQEDIVRTVKVTGHFISASGTIAPPHFSEGNITVADWETGESSIDTAVEITEDLSSGVKHASNRLIVNFVDSISFERVQEILMDHNLTLASWAPKLNAFEIELTEDEDEETIRAQLLNQAEVSSVGWNVALEWLGPPTNILDTLMPVDQAIYLNLIRAKLGWNITKGDPVIKVAVIDTGADLDHPDLENQIVAYSSCIRCGSANDNENHGTPVAGIIAAEDGNEGISGVSPDSRLIVVKPAKYDPLWFSLADAITEATDEGARVINMSIGSSPPPELFEPLFNTGTLRKAIDYAYQEDVVLIAAAGYSSQCHCEQGMEIIDADYGWHGNVIYPASYTKVLAVGASDKSDGIGFTSNYGDNVIFAPADFTFDDFWSTTYDGGYGDVGGGNSFASPQVAALAALILSVDPNMHNWEVMDIIKQTADQTITGSLGRINVFRALTVASGNPDPGEDPLPLKSSNLEVALKQDSSSFFVGLTWTPPNKDYAGVHIYREDVSSNEMVQLEGSLITGTSYEDRNVEEGKRYTYYIFSVDSPFGQESVDHLKGSIHVSNEPPNQPDNPTPNNNAINQSLNVDLSWDGGDPDGDSVTYDVYLEAGNSAPNVPVCNDRPTTTCDPGQLNYNTHYYWQVIARDEHGATTAGHVWDFRTGVEPNTNPDMPGNPSPADGATNRSINTDLAWTGGDPDGDAVTYDVYFEAGDSSPDELVCNDTTTTTCDPGTLSYEFHYYWQVIARDEHGATTTGHVWDFTTAPAPACVPSLISPAVGTIMDNGRIGRLDNIVWDFDWSDCNGATSYHLYVIGPDATNPVINDTIEVSAYHFVDNAYIISQYYEGWQWRVRAYVNGQWGGWSATRTFDVEPLNTDPPFNDDFDEAITVNDTPYSTTQSGIGATTAHDDPVIPCVSEQKHNTVWYRFIPPSDGTLSVNTFGSDYDTVLALWTGTRGSLTNVACNDDSSGLQSSVATSVFGGTAYYLEIASYSSSAGMLDLSAGFEPNTPPYVPSNPLPADGATNRSINTDLTWSGGDPDGAPVTYDVYLEANDNTPDVLVSNSQSSTTFDPGALLEETAYYWQIVAQDVHGAVTEGPIWYFVTQPSASICYPDLPNPQLSFDHHEYYTADGQDWVRYVLTVDNRSSFPDVLFEPAPHLPPCGLNDDSSRTWVRIFEGNGDYLYGFCGLSSSDQLDGIWFGEPVGTAPPDTAYIVLWDRECDITYQSNEVDIPLP